MVNNYIKSKNGNFIFFDDRDERQTQEARAFAEFHAPRIDVCQRPPALAHVSVYRRLACWPDILEVGEVRDRVLDLKVVA